MIEIDFGQLRSLILAPSSYNWRMLCGVLDRYERLWGGLQMSESVLPYLRHHIERWPPSILRYATHTWVYRAMEGREVKQLEFASAFHFVGQETTHEGLQLLFEAPNLARIRHVDLSKAQSCDASVVASALENPFMEQLSSMTLRSAVVRRMPCDMIHTIRQRGILLE